MDRADIKTTRWEELTGDYIKIAESELDKMQERSRKMHLSSHIRTTIMIFAFEIIYLLILAIRGEVNFKYHVVWYAIVPSSLNFLLYLLVRYLNNLPNFRFNKNAMLVLASGIQVFIYATVHQFYIMVNASYLTTLFLSTIYDDKKMVRCTGILAIFGMLCSAFVIKYDPTYHVTSADVFNFLALTFTMLAARYIAEYVVTVNIDKRRKVNNVIQEKEQYWNGLMIDTLSGLYSRNALRIFVDKLKAREDNEPICIAMIDIDRFKNINDTFGHQYGDEVIKHLGETIKKYYNLGVVAFRYGGEEILCMVEGEQMTVKKIISEIKDSFTDLCNTMLNNPNITFSAGISRADKSQTMAESLKQADMALYQAKDNGRNKVEIYF